MKLGIYGGSFNPPHLCHVLNVSLALSSREVDRVLVIPCLSHAFSKALAGYEHRMEMCRQAFSIFGARVQVSTLEQELGGVSYTVDTLRHLSRTRPEDTLRLVMGSDLLAEMKDWKEPEEVRRLAPPLVIGRQEHEAEASTVFPWALPDLSSTTIRALLHSGEVPRGMLPAAVLDHILKNGLYRAGIREEGA